MRKLSDWIKKNILNEKETENTDRRKDNIVDENKNEENNNEESVSVIKIEKPKEKIYISHMDVYFWEAGRVVLKKVCVDLKRQLQKIELSL